MKYAFIEEQRTQHSVRRMCRLLSVSAAGFYEWRVRPQSPRALRELELKAAIVQIHSESRRTYGRPRVHAELNAQGLRVSPMRVMKIMKKAGIAGVRARRFRTTTDSKHTLPIAPNLIDRKFDVAEIPDVNRLWAGDITYIETKEGWLYLAVVLDLKSRRVIGWSMSERIDSKLVCAALLAAIKDRRPEHGTIFHSERCSQYASNEFRALLDEHGLLGSMSRKGNCWDNAVSESFFGSLKSDLRDPVWESHASARAGIFDYIEVWYNRKRRHSSLNYVSPETFESLLPIAA